MNIGNKPTRALAAILALCVFAFGLHQAFVLPHLDDRIHKAEGFDTDVLGEENTDRDTTSDSETDETVGDPIFEQYMTLIESSDDVLIPSGYLPLRFSRRYHHQDTGIDSYVRHQIIDEETFHLGPRIDLCTGSLGLNWGNTLEMQLYLPGQIRLREMPMSVRDQQFHIRRPGADWGGSSGWVHVDRMESSAHALSKSGERWIAQRTEGQNTFYDFFDGRNLRYTFTSGGSLLSIAYIGNGGDQVLEQINIEQEDGYKKICYAGFSALERPFLKVYYSGYWTTYAENELDEMEFPLVNRIQVCMGALDDEEEEITVVHQEIRYIYSQKCESQDTDLLPALVCEEGASVPTLGRVEWYDLTPSGDPNGELQFTRAVNYSYNQSGLMTAKVTSTRPAESHASPGTEYFLHGVAWALKSGFHVGSFLIPGDAITEHSAPLTGLYWKVDGVALNGMNAPDPTFVRAPLLMARHSKTIQAEGSSAERPYHFTLTSFVREYGETTNEAPSSRLKVFDARSKRTVAEWYPPSGFIGDGEMDLFSIFRYMNIEATAEDDPEEYTGTVQFYYYTPGSRNQRGEMTVTIVTPNSELPGGLSAPPGNEETHVHVSRTFYSDTAGKISQVQAVESGWLKPGYITGRPTLQFGLWPLAETPEIEKEDFDVASYRRIEFGYADSEVSLENLADALDLAGVGGPDYDDSYSSTAAGLPSVTTIFSLESESPAVLHPMTKIEVDYDRLLPESVRTYYYHYPSDRWVKSHAIDYGLYDDMHPGMVTTVQYDDKETTVPGIYVQNPVAAVRTSLEYDDAGKLLSSLALGGLGYDVAVGPWTQRTYTPFGLPETVSSESGGTPLQRTEFEYQRMMKVAQVTHRVDPDGGNEITRSIDFVRDHMGRLIGRTDSAGGATEIGYDKFGFRNRQSQQIKVMDGVTTSTLGGLGTMTVKNLANESEAWGVVAVEGSNWTGESSGTYPLSVLETLTRRPGSSTVEGVIDVKDLTETIVAPSTLFAASGRGDGYIHQRRDGVIMTVTPPDYTDDDERIFATATGDAQTTLSLIATMTNKGTGTFSLDELKRKRDSNTESRTTFAYSDADSRRLIKMSREYAKGFSGSEVNTGNAEFIYDDAGRVATIHHHDDTITSPTTSNSRVYSTHYSYDGAGRVATLSISQGPKGMGSGGRGIKFYYDSAGRLYGRDYYYRDTLLFLPNNFGSSNTTMVLEERRTFDGAGRVKSTAFKARNAATTGLELVRKYEYSYNEAGWISEIVQTGGSPLDNDETLDHAYLSAFGNTVAETAGAGQVVVRRSFVYDSLGRLLSEVRRYEMGDSSPVILEREWTFSYTPAGELVSVEELPARPLGDPGAAVVGEEITVAEEEFSRPEEANAEPVFGYDGDMFRMAHRAYEAFMFEWDALTGELSQASAPRWHTEDYRYDAGSQLVAARRTTYNSSLMEDQIQWTSKSYWFGGNELLETVTHGQGLGSVNEYWQYYYTGGMDSLWGASRNFSNWSAKEYFIIPDHLGSVALILELEVEVAYEPEEEQGMMMFGGGGLEIGAFESEESEFLAVASDGSVSVSSIADGVIAMEEGMIVFESADGKRTTLAADGDDLVVISSGESTVIADGGAGLSMSLMEDGDAKFSLPGGGGAMSSFGGGPALESFGLKAVEAVEYTPYGVPTIHSRAWNGAAQLRYFDDEKVTATSGGLVPSNTREGAVLHTSAWLSMTDSPVGASNSQYRVENSAAQSSIGWKHLYTARAWSPVSETYYYRARWYAPELGRFISRDPIGYLGGLNQYMYVGGNPINFVDPTGLEGETCTPSEDYDIYQITVFVDDTTPEGLNADNVGHTYIGLLVLGTNQEVLSEEYLGLYPRTENRRLSSFFVVRGELRDDAGHPFSRSMSWSLSPSAMQGARGAIAGDKAKEAEGKLMYQLSTDNCSHWAGRILDAAGVDYSGFELNPAASVSDEYRLGEPFGAQGSSSKKTQRVIGVRYGNSRFIKGFLQ